jgi:hypothetical protein
VTLGAAIVGDEADAFSECVGAYLPRRHSVVAFGWGRSSLPLPPGGRRDPTF